MNKVSWTSGKNLEKYVWVYLFLERATLLKMNFILGIFKDFV